MTRRKGTRDFIFVSPEGRISSRKRFTETTEKRNGFGSYRNPEKELEIVERVGWGSCQGIWGGIRRHYKRTVRREEVGVTETRYSPGVERH